MHSDNPPISAQAVGHLPVIKATVLKRVDAKLPQAKSHVDILKVKKSSMEGGFVNHLCDIR